MFRLITGTAIDLRLLVTSGPRHSVGLFKTIDTGDDKVDDDDDTIGSASNGGNMILDSVRSEIGGVGPGFHEMEGMGMSGQEQLFLRRVLTLEIDDDMGSGFIW